MFAKISTALFVAACLVCSMPAAHAIDPVIGYPFGYSLGYQNSFRNRLPTPPYFSVYPPVYYGKRYARPYGDSPYASWPQLQSSPDYHAVPRETPFLNQGVTVRSRTIQVPQQYSAEADYNPGEVVQTRRVGGPRTVVNPYAQDESHVVSRP